MQRAAKQGDGVTTVKGMASAAVGVTITRKSEWEWGNHAVGSVDVEIAFGRQRGAAVLLGQQI